MGLRGLLWEHPPFTLLQLLVQKFWSDLRNRDSSAGIVTSLRTWRPMNNGYITGWGKVYILFSTVSGMVFGNQLISFQTAKRCSSVWVRRLDLSADFLLTSFARISGSCLYVYTRPYISKIPGLNIMDTELVM